MLKLRTSADNLFLLMLATACAAGVGCAQEYVENVQPVMIDSKQAVQMVLAQAAPEYPPVAKVNYLTGQVRLELTIDSMGKVVRSHVVQGDAILAEAALQATHRWLYRPLTTPSGPAGFMTTVQLKFNLACRGLDQLPPPQAERDFLRQVKPPQLVRPPEDPPSDDVVHIRLLVNDQGKVDDMQISPMGSQQFEAASETVRRWTFRPAHWGNMPVASYIDVKVPVSAPSISRAAADVGQTMARCGP